MWKCTKFYHGKLKKSRCKVCNIVHQSLKLEKNGAFKLKVTLVHKYEMCPDQSKCYSV